jgi:hypothetical protein
MAFLTIEPAVGLSEAALQRAVENGPPEVAIAAPHAEMLATAGFVELQVVDVTAEFSRTQQAWTDLWSAHEEELVDLLGCEAVDQRKKDRQAMRSAIDEHLLRRTLYIARRPDLQRTNP